MVNRISTECLVAAIKKVRVMDNNKKEELVDEIYRKQPNLLASVLVQKKLGVSLEKMELLMDLLLICYQSMKQTEIHWPVISEDEQAHQMSRFVATVKFTEGLNDSNTRTVMETYIDHHPEKELLAFIYGELEKWLDGIDKEESDKYVVLSAVNLANCIAYVPIPRPNHQIQPTAYLGG